MDLLVRDFQEKHPLPPLKRGGIEQRHISLKRGNRTKIYLFKEGELR
jgi:hypothetical protein